VETVERARSLQERPRLAGLGALMGVVTATVAVGVAQLVAGAVRPESSPIVTVGQAAIDRTPERLKDYAIRTFGSSDKSVLLLGIGAVLLLISVLLGVASVRHVWAGVIGLASFAAVGATATLSRPALGAVDTLPTIAGAAAGVITLLALHRSLEGSGARSDGSDNDRGSGTIDRRRFFATAAGGALVAFAAGGIGNVLARRLRADESRAGVSIPEPTSPAGSAAGSGARVDGLSPFFTPNDRFYRVDTALLVPSVQAEDWRFRIHGMVDREIDLDYRGLLDRPLVERDVTLACVSNPVGGSYVGNARWIGAPLADLLGEAGVHAGADQIVTRSVDGFTVGTPTAIASDGRDAMLAVAMNGEPLPLAHGFPVRMIVPGLYGYVSATKWVVDMELTTFDAFDPYWIERGWSEPRPIKTQSRIDTPRSLAQVPPGTVMVAGVAWAQHRGIERVEVQVDDGPFNAATLANEDTIDTWRQWVFPWKATAGEHRVRVRATDGDGETQTEARSDPVPDGATGLHEVVVEVA
jgi:DMSO/TMAO reductase YedYZ molybdopterin-dependent catalytic subunit